MLGTGMVIEPLGYRVPGDAPVESLRSCRRSISSFRASVIVVCFDWLGFIVLLAFNKPYGVLSQFTPEPGSRWSTLAEFRLPPGVYPLGRLDADSEGLLLLSDEPGLNTRLLDPRHAHAREYWALVERVPDDAALARLARGVTFGRAQQDCAPTARAFTALPSRVRRLEPPPALPPREPPVRYRKNVPDCWLALELTEGKNRQVRRMTAAVGHPTLRLVRARIGALTLASLVLAPGKWRELTAAERAAVFSRTVAQHLI
jgi:23S rRNA pseudouridine2457 synthase